MSDNISNVVELRNAALAVVERWDSPNWKDQPHTAEFIHRLRKAIADVPAPQDQTMPIQENSLKNESPF